MSTITPALFLRSLGKWAIPVVLHQRLDRCLKREVSWAGHTARRYADCSSKGTWDAHGIAVHWTAGPTPWTYVWDGRLEEKLPGPLYTGLIYPDGVLHLTGWRTTNNTGMCDRTVFDRVVLDRMPYGHTVEPGADDYGSANLALYGFAYRADPDNPPTPAAKLTMRRTCAALCEAHGWTGSSIAGHKELSQRKPLCPGDDMADLRRDVRELLA